LARPKKERLSKHEIERRLGVSIHALQQIEKLIYFNTTERGMLLAQAAILAFLRKDIAESIIVP
jgi:transcriptional regulator with XRE-family HTH domain